MVVSPAGIDLHGDVHVLKRVMAVMLCSVRQSVDNSVICSLRNSCIPNGNG